MLRAALLVAVLAGPVAADCVATDFLSLPLPRGGDPLETAVEVAYPGTDLDGDRLRLPDGTVLTISRAGHADPSTRLQAATFADQFAQVYPLDFDLEARRTPWFDPGRARDEAFFRALWFDSAEAARASLATVVYRGETVTARFNVTEKHCTAPQLALALQEIAALGPDMDRFFVNPGGSFNWRLIAGTNRLSAHSFGTAIDLNTALGGYWRWSGEPEGAVGDYANRIPEALVRAMERRGFIWGGKWHHYDGMHFEYRPELILFARQSGG